jgi:cytochrome c oxidase assembly protein subunit 15
LIFIQLILGATMRHQHAGLAVPDFPLAYGKLWPATDTASVELYNAHRLEAAGEAPITAPHIVVHMLHRFTAFAVLFAIIGCAIVTWRNTTRGSLLRKTSGLWVAIAFVQVALGILTILSQRKVDVTTAHVAIGALAFVMGWMLVLIASRSVTMTLTEQVRERADSAVRAPMAPEFTHA